MIAAATIDRATFVALQETTGRQFVAALVTTFLEEAPTMLRELRAAATSRDAHAFRRAAHSLKSNALAFGALPLAEIAKRLELAGLEAAHDQEPAALAAVEAEYARVAHELGALRDA